MQGISKDLEQVMRKRYNTVLRINQQFKMKQYEKRKFESYTFGFKLLKRTIDEIKLKFTSFSLFMINDYSKEVAQYEEQRFYLGKNLQKIKDQNNPTNTIQEIKEIKTKFWDPFHCYLFYSELQAEADETRINLYAEEPWFQQEQKELKAIKFKKFILKAKIC